MLKIYFDTRALLLATREEAVEASYEGITASITGGADIQVQEVFEDTARYPTGLLCWTNDSEALLNELKRQLLVMRAGGGFVHTPDKKVLLIFRRGKWDLPKGKLDAGESLPDCAVREVAEETGLTVASLGDPLSTTYHIYKEKGELILKESYWYMMRSEAASPLVPQTEEDIEECRWVHANDLHIYFSNAQPSIVDILKEGAAKLED